jgi:hypothetical protein
MTTDGPHGARNANETRQAEAVWLERGEDATDPDGTTKDRPRNQLQRRDRRRHLRAHRDLEGFALHPPIDRDEGFLDVAESESRDANQLFVSRL